MKTAFHTQKTLNSGQKYQQHREIIAFCSEWKHDEGFNVNNGLNGRLFIYSFGILKNKTHQTVTYES